MRYTAPIISAAMLAAACSGGEPPAQSQVQPVKAEEVPVAQASDAQESEEVAAREISQAKDLQGPEPAPSLPALPAGTAYHNQRVSHLDALFKSALPFDWDNLEMVCPRKTGPRFERGSALIWS